MAAVSLFLALATLGCVLSLSNGGSPQHSPDTYVLRQLPRYLQAAKPPQPGSPPQGPAATTVNGGAPGNRPRTRSKQVLIWPPPAVKASPGVSCSDKPPTNITPRRYHENLPVPLDWLRYDGLSPFLTKQPEVKGRDITIPLQGRGKEKPGSMDPFGAGARISSVYAYKGGRVCSTFVNPDPRSGTIAGMYLIDFHPTGSLRNRTKWHEVDFEWLGVNSREVHLSLFEKGLDMPFATTTDLRNATGIRGLSVRDQGTRYCIVWDFLSPTAKYVRFSLQAQGRPEVVLREWKPKTPEMNTFWDTPIRVLFTYWSSASHVTWSGRYNLSATTVLNVDFKDIEFQPQGEPWCVLMDQDLEPQP